MQKSRQVKTNEIRLADLDSMDRAALIVAWTEVFGTSVPRHLSQAFLRRFLATELQARARGGVSKRSLARLETLSGKIQAARMRGGLRPGTRLLREWNGVTHVVDVTEDGFEWRGATWRSLSAIAREITGAHWSGPRFFGLSGKSAP